MSTLEKLNKSAPISIKYRDAMLKFEICNHTKNVTFNNSKYYVSFFIFCHILSRLKLINYGISTPYDNC